jgi:hypothetical protein
MTNETKPPVFSEWEDCDCNQCEHYWDSSCDGVGKDKRKLCGQFSATRSVIIPEQIKDLEKQVTILKWCVVILAWIDILTIVGGWF